MHDSTIATEIAGIALNLSAIQSILNTLAEKDPNNGLHYALEVLVDRVQESIDAIYRGGVR